LANCSIMLILTQTVRSRFCRVALKKFKYLHCLNLVT
jgi:hypothetical protein